MCAQGVSTRLARLALSLRSEQRSLFGSGVSMPDGWDIILVLFIADADGRRLTVGEVVAAAEEGAEGGRRRIAHLSRAGIVTGDGQGNVDDVVTLSPEAVTKVETLIERVWAVIGTA